MLHRDKASAQKAGTEIDDKRDKNPLNQTSNSANKQHRKTEIDENITDEKKIGSSLKKPLPMQADLCRLERQK